MNKKQQIKLATFTLKRKTAAQKFFTGLMDGDGSIQCNHWRKKYIQYRLVIKLKDDPFNRKMLEEISEFIGGNVRQVNNCVLWVENHQRKIWEICEIFSRYPPLTTRIQCQLEFLQQCRMRKDVDWMLASRQNKYSTQSLRRQKMDQEFQEERHYFPEWCSGFIEAEGCFSLRKNGRHSFSIGQKGDKYLVESIRRYFGGVNQVRFINNEFYLWEVYRKSVLEKMQSHCKITPLWGEKAESARLFFCQL